MGGAARSLVPITVHSPLPHASTTPRTAGAKSWAVEASAIPRMSSTRRETFSLTSRGMAPGRRAGGNAGGGGGGREPRRDLRPVRGGAHRRAERPRHLSPRRRRQHVEDAGPRSGPGPGAEPSGRRPAARGDAPGTQGRGVLPRDAPALRGSQHGAGGGDRKG